MSWTQLRVSAVDAEARDLVIGALVAAGGSCAEEGDTLVTFVLDEPDGEASVSAARGAVLAASPGADVALTPGLTIDWSTQWPTRVGMQRVGALTVAPPWLADDAGDPARAIIIEPAMAFGTGEHPTTRGVLRLMQRVVRPGDFVADLGAGSAVLAIAAAKLGASRVLAVELDPDAIGNAEENVERNAVSHRVSVLEGDAVLVLPLVAPVRVILANIISSVLRALSPAMLAALAPDGRAILSGMLVAERDEMRAALERDGWRFDDEDAEGDWWSATVGRR
ncbi:MAG: 50S ribosomal protein L11 methyltransferase [Gemmatimonadaceae bacterium]